jgi:cobalt-zinc-cadmium efflux system protein
MAADAAISAGVVAAGFVILLTGWLWLDPAVSLVIVGVIIWGTLDLLRDSVTMSRDAVPAAINLVDVEKMLLGRSGV